MKAEYFKLNEETGELMPVEISEETKAKLRADFDERFDTDFINKEIKKLQKQ